VHASLSYAILLLCSSALMVLEEKKRIRIGKPFPKSETGRTVYQAIYAALMLLGVTATLAAAVATSST
jgi:hypothetical protein